MTGLKSPSLADGYEALQHRALARYEGLNVPTRNAHLRSIHLSISRRRILSTNRPNMSPTKILSVGDMAGRFLSSDLSPANGRREMRLQTLGFSRPWEQFWLVAQCDFR